MHITAMPSVELLLQAGRAVFLVFSFVLAAITFTAWRRATRAQTNHILAQSQSLLHGLTALEARLGATAVAITRLDERIERQGERIERHGPQTRAGSPGYEIAIRLARSGASRDELMASCGLSGSEAELVRRLHGASQAAGTLRA